MSVICHHVCHACKTLTPQLTKYFHIVKLLLKYEAVSGVDTLCRIRHQPQDHIQTIHLTGPYQYYTPYFRSICA